MAAKVKVERTNPDPQNKRNSQHQGRITRRPLRLLSSFFCLNPTHQNHITLPFVQIVVSTLNDQNLDWP